MTKRNYLFYKALENARRRCNEPKNNRYQYYGAKGIRCELTLPEVRNLVRRYHADKMRKPQLHRLDDSKNYTVQNCCFIEASEHSRITHLGKKESANAKRNMSLAGGTLYGEKHGMAILKLHQVKTILSSKNTGVSLARTFGVSECTISAIRKRRIWAWVK